MNFARSKILALALVVALVGVGATAAMADDVTGDVDAVSSQAITVSASATSGDYDAGFTRIGEDDNEFQNAFELNNGDDYSITPTINNDAADDHIVEITVNTPDGVQVESHTSVVQNSDNTYVLNVPGGGSASPTFEFELDDDAEPGHYEISMSINVLSQEE